MGNLVANFVANGRVIRKGTNFELHVGILAQEGICLVLLEDNLLLRKANNSFSDQGCVVQK